jgi:PadR family transcriptional regulator PadR
MKLENTKAQMRKGVLELITLSIISKKEVYPSDIIRELKEAELIVVEGTMYPMLNRLKNAGLLTYNWQESSSGPPRKYFQITEEGTKFLEELRETWNKLDKAIKKTTITNKKQN